MTTDLSLLLPLTVLWPMLLAGLSLLPGWGPRMLMLLPLGPLPALAAALVAPRDTLVELPGVLLDGGLELTATGALFLGGAATLWFCAGVYAAFYMRRDSRPTTFALFWNLVLAGNLGVFIAADIISFYVFFALVSLLAYPLVIHDRKPASMRAGTVYLVLALTGEMAILVGLMLASFGAEGAIGIEAVRAGLALPSAHPVALGLLIAGFGTKAGLMPLHVWLPVAHPAAPVPASAVLSGAIVKAGIFGLVAFLPLGTPEVVAGNVLMILGFAGLFVAALLALGQGGAKSVLAYSTVSQMGLVMGVLGFALAQGSAPATVLPAAALFALHHGLAKGALFLGVGLAPTCGQSWRWVLLAVLAVLGLSLAGAPLLAGALVKSALKDPAGAFGATLIGLSGLTTALAMARYLAVLPRSKPHRRPRARLSLPFLALAGAALWLPQELNAGITGRVPMAADLRLLFVDAWPLGLAVVMVVGAIAVGLRAPALPEGDALGPLQRWTAAATSAARAAGRAGSRSLRQSRSKPVTVIGENLDRIEDIFSEVASAAILLLAVAGGILAAGLL
ncbi:complex I subunit 5 family protein [Paracoccus hibiscisoli]|uniref:complex I subunit 5 family protein n=1 Tax=Paracoccus hibiscisoli TaxID=2023261 RepID=UPI0023F117B1|nr:complex I subunit 5 family protein [Paracoccus hibiscisoli]